ncbi:DNA replication and repair protein RecO [Candidatus Koribacter versatilis Ellin345]|uniref:DNA repair protein RecO n=1 Tax=Koribacter versatilis (strain Ellin345) TaxID=204669 RepID=RECO_KORVE|nr:DNA repair protein RecO [Candidatus Koribacter versatilis]Q1ISF4.1 RecName: Full=DNA repair protein RecO; AltName: Full=Recombination protein O [Candidatus Koribacter versatilis Ellin345]ABF40196.1 DNA replication and repair protein RecO [Candidatus Koribacter versatilis Ellin345]
MLKQSEAIVLRTYPMREADLLVTLFTRAEGKIKGVAKAAKKSRRRFGGALEPLTHVRVYYEDRERQELTRLDSCDVLASPMSAEVDYPRALALGHVAEVIDDLLPDREPNDAVFRLSLAVLGQLVPGAVWMPLTYFDLWMVRLAGFLPDLMHCVVCGEELDDRAFFHPLVDGLVCANDKRLASTELTVESRAIADLMFRAPLENFAGAPWPRQRCADLRRFLVQILERHLEKKLVTVTMLDKLD